MKNLQIIVCCLVSGLVDLTACTKETYVEGIAPEPAPASTQIPVPTSIVGDRTLKNRYRNTYIRVTNGAVTCDSTTISWSMSRTSGNPTQYYFRSGASYLAANSSGQVVVVNQQSAGTAWVLETVDATYQFIKNVDTGSYLNTENGPLVSSPIQSGWFSAMWVIAP